MDRRKHIDSIKAQIFSSREFAALKDRLKELGSGNVLVLRGVAGSLLAFITAWIARGHDGHVLLVASDGERAEKLRDDCVLLAGEENVRFFGPRPHHANAQQFDLTPALAQIETLKTLTSGRKVLVVASPESLAEKTPSPEAFKGSAMTLAEGSECHFENLLKRLEDDGFERKEFVEGYGDYSVRGGIVDVYSYGGENPLRIEFWGNTIESIREFDAVSQRSIRQLDQAGLIPSLTRNTGEGGGSLGSSLFDYLGKGAIILLDEPALIEREIADLVDEQGTVLLTYQDIVRRLGEFGLVVNGKFSAPLAATVSHGPLPEIDFSSSPQPLFNGSIKSLVETLQKLAREDYRIYLGCDTAEEAGRINELIEEAFTAPRDEAGDGIDQPSSSLPYPGAEVFTETFHSGFTYRPGKIAVFTEHEIFGRLKRRGIVTQRGRTFLIRRAYLKALVSELSSGRPHRDV